MLKITEQIDDDGEVRQIPKYDNAPGIPFGHIEPLGYEAENMGINADFLPLVFASVLPAPVHVFRSICFSAKMKPNLNSRLRILLYHSKEKKFCVGDIGFRFICLTLDADEDVATPEIRSTMQELRVQLMVGPIHFAYTINDDVARTPYCVERLPIDYPPYYIEIRGSMEYINQFHTRSSYPLVWPPQQNRNHMEIMNIFFHYTININVKAGHCFIVTFRPYHAKGGIGIQLKSGPYRQTPLSIFGYFDSNEPVRIEATNDRFEFERVEFSEDFPFEFDQDNRVAILMTEDQFVIAINGKMFYKYHYRNYDLPESLTDLKINTDKDTKVLCSSVHSAFIANGENADELIVKYSKLETEFRSDYFPQHYDRPF